MTTIIICLSVIICVGFVCASFIHVHTKDLESETLKELQQTLLVSNETIYSRFEAIEKNIKEINIIAEDARKQLTAHNVAQGFKIGK